MAKTAKEKRDEYLSRPGVRDRINARKRERRKENSHYRITEILRRRVRYLIHGRVSKLTEDLVGCTSKEFLDHIEKQFKDGMTWYNRDKWELDHIKPCNRFDLTDEEQQKKCFNFSNYQPLWSGENASKGDRYEE